MKGGGVVDELVVSASVEGGESVQTHCSAVGCGVVDPVSAVEVDPRVIYQSSASVGSGFGGDAVSDCQICDGVISEEQDES